MPDKFRSTSHITSLWYTQASAVRLRASGHLYDTENPLGQGLQDENPVSGNARNSTMPLTFL